MRQDPLMSLVRFERGERKYEPGSEIEEKPNLLLARKFLKVLCPSLRIWTEREHLQLLRTFEKRAEEGRKKGFKSAQLSRSEERVS